MTDANYPISFLRCVISELISLSRRYRTKVSYGYRPEGIVRRYPEGIVRYRRYRPEGTVSGRKSHRVNREKLDVPLVSTINFELFQRFGVRCVPLIV